MTPSLKPFDQMAYDPVTEMLTDIMCAKTQNSERMFFRIASSYYWGVLASQMHAGIQGWGGREVIGFYSFPHSTAVVDVSQGIKKMFTNKGRERRKLEGKGEGENGGGKEGRRKEGKGKPVRFIANRNGYNTHSNRLSSNQREHGSSV